MIWLWIARKLEEPCNRKEKENNIKLSSTSQESIISICRCWNLNCRGGNSLMGEVYKGWLCPWGQLGSKIGKEDEERKDVIEFPTDDVGCWKCRNVCEGGTQSFMEMNVFRDKRLPGSPVLLGMEGTSGYVRRIP